MNDDVGTLAEELHLLATALTQDEDGAGGGLLQSIRRHLQPDGEPRPDVQRIDLT